MNKIYKNLNKLKIKLNPKRKNNKIVLCHGVFDLLHVGHIKHFEQAKKHGDILIVSVTPDRFVNKGPFKPVFNEDHRIEAISALELVDYVVLNNKKTAVNVIKKIRPNFYCKGSEYKKIKNDLTKEIKNELKAIKSINGQIIFTGGEVFSSSKILNMTSSFSKTHQVIIKNIKKKYSFSDIKSLIESLKNLKVLIIGETIIDQYVFCEALGKSGKESVLVLKDVYTENYLGGAAAIAKNLSNISKNITLLSMIGEKEEFKKLIQKDLPKNVKLDFLKKKNSPTIIKRRFLDKVNNNKVLGVYSLNDDLLNKPNEKKFHNKLQKLLPKFDCVIVSDYGHGLISKKSAQIICKKSKYLALNAQINSANVGYHSFKNYRGINNVVINATELQQNLRDKNSKTEILMKKLSNLNSINDLTVTRGESGAILYNKKNKKFYYSSAYAKNKVDKIGAGDTMLGIISLCLKAKMSKNLSLLIASLAAGKSVENFANQQVIDKISILKSIENFLK